MNERFLKLCSEGKLEEAKLLIENGSVDPCYQKNDRKNALHIAAENEDIKTAIWLLKIDNSKFMLEARDKQGFSPLAVAASKGNIQLCNILLEAGANIHTRDNDLKNILIRAIINENTKTALWAIPLSNINTTDKYGRNALHYACEIGNIEIIRKLIKNGCDINVMDGYGLTPLGCAINKNYRYEIAEFLYAKGADIDISRKNFQPIIYTMIENRNVNAIRFLLNHGANTLLHGKQYQNVWSALNRYQLYEFEEPAKFIGRTILETKHPRLNDGNPKISEEIFYQAQENIFYFEHSDKHVIAVTENGQKELKMTLKSICARLTDKGFIMPHSGFVVNLAKVERIIGYKMIMKNGDILPISQKRSVETRKEYKLFSKNHI